MEVEVCFTAEHDPDIKTQEVSKVLGCKYSHVLISFNAQCSAATGLLKLMCEYLTGG